MRNRAIPWAPILLLLATGCATHQQPHAKPAIGSRYIAPEAGFTGQQKQLAATLCFKGMPEKTSDQLGPTEFIFRQGYVLEHSSLDKIPLWVCEHVTATQLGTDTDRSNHFLADPDLKGPHSTPADYAHSGYDQGHQAPAADQGKDQTLQNQTFYMSNMAPQLPHLNRDAWKSLEAQTRKWVDTYTEAWEFTGPIFYDPKEDNRQTADGTIKYWTIGKDAVSVPTHFYKIVIVKVDTHWKSIAFVMPNVSTYKSPYHLEQYLQSIQWIEQHTGLNFMPALTAQQSQDLEAQPSPMWTDPNVQP
jgi:endonuclease G, mitochondrial